jgi:hypothetical protein
MIYGYESQQLNEYGLKQMREISVKVSPDMLRKLAAFLLKTADEAECANSDHWHRHVPEPIRDGLKCDFIILKP